MSVLVLVQGNPLPDKTEVLQRYQQAARAVIGKHGGQPVALGSGLTTLHGSRQWKVGVVIRFPDMATVNAWYNDPEYQSVLPLRNEAYGDGNLEITVFQE